VNQAILSGDLLYALVNKLLANSNSQSTEIHQLFQQTSVQVCEGQSLDMEFENKENISLDEYINMIQLKTSVLVACGLKIGALVGEAGPKDANLLYDFGLNLGTAFQIHDDILDVYPLKEEFGKQVGGDILEKKKTILLIELLKKSSKEDKVSIIQVLEDDEIDKNLKIKKIKNFYNKYGVLELAEHTKNQYFEKAIYCVNNINLSEDKKQQIKAFAVALMSREI
jgi:geranylgeranyl diphosphate synthase type II